VHPETGQVLMSSCNIDAIKTTDKCSGRGICVPWDKSEQVLLERSVPVF